MGRNKVYSCKAEGCEKVFVSLQGFKEHAKEHGAVRYECPIKGCGKSFKWRSSLASHKKSHQVKAKKDEIETLSLSDSASETESMPGSPLSFGSLVEDFDMCHKTMFDYGDNVSACRKQDSLYLIATENLCSPTAWDI
mmetsp:Transcript_23749/g.93515  ORF Transcript_23749/g.93515 Transcript_23749/m.93515 type:complete len:138 (-) Transcript_23749:399-812(-)